MSHLDLHVIQLPILLDAEVPVLRHRDHAGLGADHEVVLAAAVYSKPRNAKEVNDSLQLKCDATLQHQSIATAQCSPQATVVPVRVGGDQGDDLAAGRGVLPDGDLVTRLREPGLHVADTADLKNISFGD